MPKQELSLWRDRCVIVSSPKKGATLDTERLKKWINIIRQFLPMILAFFDAPSPGPAPSPVQSGASITTIEGLLDYVEKQMELRSLTEEQQTKLMNAVEVLSAFLSI